MTPQNMIIPDLIKSLATVTDMDMQTYLWHDTSTDWSEIRISGEDNVSNLRRNTSGANSRYYWLYSFSIGGIIGLFERLGRCD